MSRCAALALTAAWTFAGCGDGARDLPVTPTATVRDSAGITIVENDALEPSHQLPWTVATEPAVDIGTVDGPEEYQLYQVQRALKLDDGRILVANSGSGEIRSYDADGTHLASWGGQGEGPGEFMRLTGVDIWPAGDSIAVWDQRLRRLTLLDADGGFGRTLTFSPMEGVDLPGYFAALPDGRLVVMGMSFSGAANGSTRIPMTFAVVSPDGTPVSTLGTFDGTETIMRISSEAVNIISVPFARGNVASLVGGQMVIAFNDRFELPVYAADAGLTRLVRLDLPPRPLTEELRTAEIERRVANAPEQARPGLRATLEEIEMPETLPAFSRIVPDALGNTWVELYRPPTEDGPTEWVVFDAEGRAQGRITTPEGLRVFQIGEDFILGSVDDEFEVEHVQLWSLTR